MTTLYSDRRAFLTAASALAGSLLLPGTALAGDSKAKRFHELMIERGIESRILWLKRPQSGEEVKLRYGIGRNVDKEGYLKAVRILRDVRAGEVKAIDPRLLDLMSAMQAWLRMNDHIAPLNILSGYRSPKTNSEVKGARNSMHLQGRAVDIHVEGIPTRTLERLAKTLNVGGVGVYLDRGFIHLDTGRVRSWKG